MFVEKAGTEPGHALRQRHQKKWRKYGEACQAEGMSFQPVALETLGGWHEGGVAVVNRPGQALARATGQEEGEVVRHLFRRLSILLVRGNAALLISRIPSHPQSYIDGISLIISLH